MVKKSNIEMNERAQELIDKNIYLLLWANDNDPIKGRIRFIKEFFIYAIKYNEELYHSSEFFPYYFGPYSVRLAYRINTLKYQGFITPIYKNMDWYYTLSEEGLKIASILSNETSIETIEKISIIKIVNRDLKLKNLLREIYINYPEYTVRSLIKDDITQLNIDQEKLMKVNDGPGFVAPISPEEKEISLKGNAARKYFNLISD